MNEIERFNIKLNEYNLGWYDKEKKLHKTIKNKEKFSEKFLMQTVEEVEQSKFAISWELCEVERKFFKERSIHFMTILAIINDGINMPNHAFLVYKDNNKYYWFESSWEYMNGIWEYDNLESLFYDIKNNFGDFVKTKYEKNNINFYKYDNIPLKASSKEFINHCLNTGELLSNAN